MKPLLLVVDDEPSVCESIQLIFEDDYVVVTTTSGTVALEILKKEQVDLLLLDYKMPGITGMDILRTLQAGNFKGKVVMITATTDADIAVRMMQNGACNYITKPFDIEQVQRVANSILKPLQTVCLFEWLEKKNNTYEFLGRASQLNALYRDAMMNIDPSQPILIQGGRGSEVDTVALAICFDTTDHPENILIWSKDIPTELELKKIQPGIVVIKELQNLGAQGINYLAQIIMRKEIRVVVTSTTPLIEIEGLPAPLFHQLEQQTIQLSDLSERPDDVKKYLEFYYAQEGGKQLDPVLLKKLSEYNWPGNLEELQGVIKSMLLANPVQPELPLRILATSPDFVWSWDELEPQLSAVLKAN